MTTYHFGVPGWAIWVSHILAGLFLLYVGKNGLDGKQMNRNVALILIITGVLAAIYHVHLYIYNATMEKEGFRLKCSRDKTQLKRCEYIQDDEPKLRQKEEYYAGR